MTPKKHHAYVAIWKANEGERIKGFALSTERETLRTSSAGAAAEKEEGEEEAEATGDEPKGRDGALTLAATIDRIVEFEPLTKRALVYIIVLG